MTTFKTKLDLMTVSMGTVGEAYVISKVTRIKIIGPFFAANINFGGSGAYQIPICVKGTEETHFIKADTRLNFGQSIFIYKERCFYGAIRPPETHGTPRWVV
jgi:hypothetical protein